MRRWIMFAIVGFLLVASAGGVALSQTQENPWADGGYAGVPLPEVDGAVSWDLLSKVDLVWDDNDIVPDYSDEIRKLDGERIKMVGFVIPLDSYGQRQLLSVNSPHCPFCLPAGPEGFVELNCEEPLEFTTEPVVVTGVFKLLIQDWVGYYYRMDDVREIKP
tara:strand:- start:266 stop:751 length:486 start_codon:yes stop_codon:yes gene_type:complete